MTLMIREFRSDHQRTEGDDMSDHPPSRHCMCPACAPSFSDQAPEPGADFAKWFRNNYPPDTVIFDPDWHAPRILRVAKYHLAPPDAAQIRAEERERIYKEVSALYSAQTVNNQNYSNDWYDAIEAALEAIRSLT